MSACNRTKAVESCLRYALSLSCTITLIMPPISSCIIQDWNNTTLFPIDGYNLPLLPSLFLNILVLHFVFGRWCFVSASLQHHPLQNKHRTILPTALLVLWYVFFNLWCAIIFITGQSCGSRPKQAEEWQPFRLGGGGADVLYFPLFLCVRDCKQFYCRRNRPLHKGTQPLPNDFVHCLYSSHMTNEFVYRSAN